jgi:alkylhydroperoxidase family enzyme
MAKQRISYIPLEQMDADMRKEMERCQREGTPRPESSAVRAHVKACFWFFANSWRDLFKNGVLDHSIKELCRLYISRSVQCDYCGNQRSVKAAGQGMIEDDVKDLLNFEKSTRYSERQKAALAYAEAIAWHLDSDDAFWERMHRHFSEPELVELGCMIGLTLGQQSWLRLLNIDHHQVLAGTSRRWRRLRKRGRAQAVEIRPAVLGKAETRMRKLAALAALVFAGATWAQTYPAKPITIIVPFTPGSATDVAARLVGEKLNAAWGQPVIVDNRPGAGGTIGIAQTARAEPDGYTLAVVSTGHVVNPVLYKDLPYDTLKDLARRGADRVAAERAGGCAEPGRQ